MLITRAGGVGHRDEKFVEYDMDLQDIAWLEKFNQGQDRLPPRRFELLIWRLEMANAEANDRHSAANGMTCPSRLSRTHLPPVQVSALSKSC